MAVKKLLGRPGSSGVPTKAKKNFLAPQRRERIKAGR
jgi:hypothetical protein